VDIREFTTYSEKSPCTGYGIWIVLEEKGRKAHLLHPVHLSELVVNEYEYYSSSGQSLWPNNSTGTSFNAQRFIESFKNRIAFFLENGRPFPMQTVAKALAGFEEISLEEALRFIGSLSVNEYGESVSKLSTKANREYVLRNGVNVNCFHGRQYDLLCAFKEHGPASIYQITNLVDGKLKTKSDLGRVVTYLVNKLASQGILEIVT
jgi:hypothetical protein